MSMMFGGGLLLLVLIVGGGLLLLLLIGLAVYLLTASGRQGRGQGNASSRQVPQEDEALRILRQRYASGEIDAETYEKMRRALTQHEPGAPAS